MQDANKNSLYVHEVFLADNITKGNTLQTAAFQPHGGISLYRDILANILLADKGSEENSDTQEKSEKTQYSLQGSLLSEEEQRIVDEMSAMHPLKAKNVFVDAFNKFNAGEINQEEYNNYYEAFKHRKWNPTKFSEDRDALLQEANDLRSRAKSQLQMANNEGNEYLAEFARMNNEKADIVESMAENAPKSEQLSQVNEEALKEYKRKEELFASAKKEYGVTDDFGIAGYMLPDGDLLDFSGGYGVRDIDHRNITSMYPNVEHDSRWDYVVDFMNDGAIRIIPESAALNMTQAPTKEQRAKIKDFVRQYGGEVIVEINNEQGGGEVYKEYDEGTKPSKVLADMDRYFDEGIRFSLPEINEINNRFNEELQQQIEGTLPTDHVYQLGMPSGILLSTGFPNMPIEITSVNLAKHARMPRHPFDLIDVKNIVKALQKPIAVFVYGDKKKSQNVIVEIKKGERNFLIGIHFNQTHRGAEVSDIRGVFPKDNAEWLNWILQGKHLYLDKQKIQDLIDKQRMTLAEVEYLDLDSVTKIINEFENPTIPEEKNEENSANSSDTQEIKPRHSLQGGRAIADKYEKRVNTKGKGGSLHLSKYNFMEAMQDEMRALKEVQRLIEEDYGVNLEDFENAYMAENALSSINQAEWERYINDYYEPMMQIVDEWFKQGENQQSINHYLIAKSGLERNREFTVRDALAEMDKMDRQIINGAYSGTVLQLANALRQGVITQDEYDVKVQEAKDKKALALENIKSVQEQRVADYRAERDALREDLQQGRISYEEFNQFY